MPFSLRPAPFLAPLFLAFFCSFLPAQLFKEPEFVEARSFQIHSLGLQTSKVQFELVYYNPNNFRLQLKEADMDVFVDERLLGHSLIDTLIDINARDSFALPVKMDVEMKNLFPNALAMLTKSEIELSVKGKAKIGKNGLYVPVPIRYKGKQSLGW